MMASAVIVQMAEIVRGVSVESPDEWAFDRASCKGAPSRSVTPDQKSAENPGSEICPGVCCRCGDSLQATPPLLFTLAPLRATKSFEIAGCYFQNGLLPPIP
jgi:hypothetical protein